MLTFNDVPQALSEILEKLSEVITILNKMDAATKVDPNERLTISEFSVQYRISKATVHELMKTQKVSFEKIGRKTLFRRVDIEAYYQSKKAKFKQ